MKKTLLISLVAIAFAGIALSPSQAQAQEGFGVGGQLVLPIGDWGDVVDLGIAPTVEYAYPLGPKMALLASVSFNYFLTDFDGVTFMAIPLLVGAKYNVAPRIHVIGQVGLDILYASIDGFDSDTETELSVNLGAGYELGNLDLRASLWFPDLSETGDLALTVGAVFHFGAGGGAPVQ